MGLILVKEKEGVLLITLSRPDKFNSINREMAMLLQSAFSEAEKNKGIRAVLLSAEGKAFCAGQDLSEAIDPNGPGLKTIVEQHYNPIILAMRNLEKPIVCAVNGVAAGAGANLALAADVVIASANASFIQAFSKIGLIPDSGGTFILPRLIGFQRALALAMLGEKVTAPEALQMGMIYKMVNHEALDETAFQMCSVLAKMPTKALGLTKRLFNRGTEKSLENQLQLEADLQVEASETDDYQEGVKAFLEKRKAEFKGA